MGYLRHRPETGPAPSPQRLQRGLPGYLILFAPHAFVAQRQGLSSRPPSPLVFLPISTDFTLTPGIPPAPPVLKFGSLPGRSTVEPQNFTGHLPNRLPTLYTQ
jgi:hypothetical protein